jgi:hypothetical protein
VITAANPLQIIRMSSATGRFIAANFHTDAFGATTANAGTLNGSILTTASVPDGYDLGQVLPAGLSASDLAADLTLAWNVFGGGISVRAGDSTVVNGVPEPTAVGLIGFGAAAPPEPAKPQLKLHWFRRTMRSARRGNLRGRALFC